tara:strand:+ start:490 stop:657 length:168 start_codon:yes stop_codon:yes gene_type:complete
MKVRKSTLEIQAWATTNEKERIVVVEHTETLRGERVSEQDTSAMNVKEESQRLGV